MVVHLGEPVDAGLSRKPHEERLRNIVTRMAEGNLVDARAARPVADETIASVARLGLKVACPAPFPRQNRVRNAALHAMAGNGVNLARRLGAKPMIDGHGFNRESKIATVPKHHVQTSHRVTASGHGDAQSPRPAPREGQTRQVPDQFVE